MMSQLQEVVWDAAESIDYDDIELDPDPSSRSRRPWRSWVFFFNMKKKWKYQSDVKSSSSSLAETKEKNYKPTW